MKKRKGAESEVTEGLESKIYTKMIIKNKYNREAWSWRRVGALTNVGVLQSADVVRAVAAHQGHVAQLVQLCDNELLLLWVEPGEDFHVRENFLKELRLVA